MSLDVAQLARQVFEHLQGRIDLTGKAHPDTVIRAVAIQLRQARAIDDSTFEALGQLSAGVRVLVEREVDRLLTERGGQL